jgi:hypothetical protein
MKKENKLEIIGTVYHKRGVYGDFEWQINSKDYEDSLFLFNEDEYRRYWKKAGKGNAIIRKYNKYAVEKPRSVGIVTGTKDGGYQSLTSSVKSNIDSCIQEAKEIIQKYNYQKVYYSAETPNGILGTSIFNVNKDVLEYITQEIHKLNKESVSESDDDKIVIIKKIKPKENQITQVVNVKVKYIRPKYENLKEWMEDTNNIYIGRKGVVFIDKLRFPKEDSIFANPYKLDEINTRDIVIEKYRTYILEKMKDQNFVNELKKLKGKNLGCWCFPEKCHGDVLVEYVNKL